MRRHARSSTGRRHSTFWHRWVLVSPLAKKSCRRLSHPTCTCCRRASASWNAAGMTGVCASSTDSSIKKTYAYCRKSDYACGVTRVGPRRCDCFWCMPTLTPLLGFAGASREAQRSAASRLPVGRACRAESSRRRGRWLRPMARRARPCLRLGSAATRERATALALFHRAGLSRAPQLAPRAAVAHVVARDTLTPRIHCRRTKRRNARSAAAQRLRVSERAAGRRDIRAVHVLPTWVIQLRLDPWISIFHRGGSSSRSSRSSRSSSLAAAGSPPPSLTHCH